LVPLIRIQRVPDSKSALRPTILTEVHQGSFQCLLSNASAESYTGHDRFLSHPSQVTVQIILTGPFPRYVTYVVEKNVVKKAKRQEYGVDTWKQKDRKFG
jgi:hypothetical protein